MSSLINGTLHYLLGALSALPRAALVVEDRYSQIFNSGTKPAPTPAHQPEGCS